MQQTIAQGWLEEGINIGEARAEKHIIERAISKMLMNLIIRIGTKRLGEPSVAIRDSLAGIADIDRLNVLLDRVFEMASWDRLLND